jgi:hypothetical protein
MIKTDESLLFLQTQPDTGLLLHFHLNVFLKIIASTSRKTGKYVDYINKNHQAGFRRAREEERWV